MDVSGKIHDLVASSLGKEPQYHLIRRMVALKSRLDAMKKRYNSTFDSCVLISRHS
jgi:hypothetical protein